MLASQELIAALNRQVGNEMGASLQYVSIAAYFDSEDLPVLARFFYRQAEEERDHAMKFVKFVVEVGSNLALPAIPAPQASFATALEAVELSLSWEHEVTQQIYALVETSKSDNNYIAQRFLDWFVTEQLEEVSTMSTLRSIVKRAGQEGLLHVEEYLSREGLAAAASAE